MKAAIIAHFDFGSVWDDNFIELLKVLSGVISLTVVVTTAQDMPDLPNNLTNIKLIRRPNIGYDFYSYRVGIDFIINKYDAEGILLLNSSLLLMDAEKFRNLILLISNENRPSGVRGLTSSNQFGWHLQSYLIYFNLHRISKDWLQKYFDQVEPVNSKFELVLKYEVGLGRLLEVDNVSVDVIFQPALIQRVSGALSYMQSLLRKQGGKIVFNKSFWYAYRDVNWTHFAASLLAHRFGVVKAELLRTNPHLLPLETIWDACHVSLRPSVKKLITRTRNFYAGSQSGLTEFCSNSDPMGIIVESVESVRHRKVNARVAAIVHLYYFELFDEILDDIANIIEPFDLYVTTPFEADISNIIDAADSRGFGVKIYLCKNKGRDVGPFIALFRTGCLDSYDAVLKLHSKKSRYSEKGDSWRRKLFAPLCGDSFAVLHSLKLIRERDCGVVGPSRYFLSNPDFWGSNKECLIKILSVCGALKGDEQPRLGFFAGTMFWFAPRALAAVYEATGLAIEFDLENGNQDGTLAHAWERAFCLLARAAGYYVSSVPLDGKDIFTIDSNENSVPVLPVRQKSH